LIYLCNLTQCNGERLKMQEKVSQSEEKSYVLSIITVTFNNAKGLSKTIEVLPSSSEQLEHLIIDGKSTDDTPLIMSTDKRNYAKWISEPDNGIYDAMNKGLSLAKGRYVLFLNAGDYFASSEVIDKICAILSRSSPDMLYGETILINSDNKIIGLRSIHTTKELPDSLNMNALRRGMVVCHQSLIVRKEIASSFINDNLSADYDWLLNATKKSDNIINLESPIAKYLVGGESKKQHLRSLYDRLTIMINHYGYFGSIWNHLLILKSIIHRSLFGRKSFDYL